ncbi:hypothetical protein MTO96_014319 [Rhipicephalus appendiculatus]
MLLPDGNVPYRLSNAYLVVNQLLARPEMNGRVLYSLDGLVLRLGAHPAAGAHERDGGSHDVADEVVDGGTVEVQLPLRDVLYGDRQSERVFD